MEAEDVDSAELQRSQIGQIGTEIYNAVVIVAVVSWQLNNVGLLGSLFPIVLVSDLWAFIKWKDKIEVFHISRLR
jgi:hypothetical protein